MLTSTGIGPGGIAAASSAVQTLNVQVIDPILRMFKNPASEWEGSIMKAAKSLSWILALVRLS